MKKKIFCLLMMAMFMSTVLCSCSHQHSWVAATSTQPKTCSVCGETEGEPLLVVPNIASVDESTAKTLLAGKGLIPSVEYVYDDLIAEGNVVRTFPGIGSVVSEDDLVTIYVSKGPRFYYLEHSVGYMMDVKNIDPFSFGSDTEACTKGFYLPYVEEGYLYIEMFLCCTSRYEIEFYRRIDSESTTETFGTASINDTFDKTVPITVLFDDYKVNNKGEETTFQVKIPLSDLGVQKPTNLYVKFDFSVNKVRQTFQAGFDLSW